MDRRSCPEDTKALGQPMAECPVEETVVPMAKPLAEEMRVSMVEPLTEEARAVAEEEPTS